MRNQTFTSCNPLPSQEGKEKQMLSFVSHSDTFLIVSIDVSCWQGECIN